MSFDHTSTPNATITFAPKPEPEDGSRRKKPDEFVLPATGSPTATEFTADCLLKPTTYKMIQALISDPELINNSSGQIYAGFWRPNNEVELPQWIRDGKDCKVVLTATRNSPAKGMPAIFCFAIARSEWAIEEECGPDFVVNTRRQN